MIPTIKYSISLIFLFCFVMGSGWSQTADPNYEPSKERLGPDNNRTYDVYSQINSDFDFKEVKVLSINRTIFGDENRPSGYYYYYPTEYNLAWTANTGEYDISINYGIADGSSMGRTTVTAILKPNFSRKDWRIAKDLLRRNLSNKEESKHGITDLIPIPMAQPPEVDFDNLGQFGVDQNHISIRVPSDLSDPIYLSFTTDRIDELMSMFFNDVGLYGDVIIYPSGKNMPSSIRIPFNLKLDSPKTFGKFELAGSNWRTSGWQNATDYPVILTHLHVMKRERGGNIGIYTWETGGVEIPEKAKASFTNAASLPSWIDNSSSVERIWLEYTVKSCRSCDFRVKDEIIGGVNRTRVANIEFTVLTPLDFSGGHMMKIKIRSFQADPSGKSKVDLPTLTVTRDGETVSGGRLYVPDGQNPEFEYFIQIYKEDGTVFKSDSWKKSNELEVVLGTKQIKSLISSLDN